MILPGERKEEASPPKWSVPLELVLFLGLTALIGDVPAWSGDWSPLGFWLLIWGALLVVVVLYGTMLWLVCSSAAWIARKIKRGRNQSGTGR